MYFAYKTCTTKLRLSSWRCGSVLLVLDLYYKVATFELEMRKCASRTRLVLQSCDFRAGSAKVRKHCKTIRSPPKRITFKKVLGPSKVFRPLLIFRMYECVNRHTYIDMRQLDMYIYLYYILYTVVGFKSRSSP